MGWKNVSIVLLSHRVDEGNDADPREKATFDKVYMLTKTEKKVFPFFSLSFLPFRCEKKVVRIDLNRHRRYKFFFF